MISNVSNTFRQNIYNTNYTAPSQQKRQQSNMVNNSNVNLTCKVNSNIDKETKNILYGIAIIFGLLGYYGFYEFYDEKVKEEQLPELKQKIETKAGTKKLLELDSIFNRGKDSADMRKRYAFFEEEYKKLLQNNNSNIKDTVSSVIKKIKK